MKFSYSDKVAIVSVIQSTLDSELRDNTLAKEAGFGNQSIANLRSGVTDIENIKFKYAISLTQYGIQELNCLVDGDVDADYLAVEAVLKSKMKTIDISRKTGIYLGTIKRYRYKNLNKVDIENMHLKNAIKLTRFAKDDSIIRNLYSN